MPLANHCFIEAKKNLSYFDNEDLQIIYNKVYERAKTYLGLKGTAATQKAIKEISEELEKDLIADLQTQINDQALEKVIADALHQKRAFVGDFVARMYSNLDYNVESSIDTSKKILIEEVISKLDQKETDFAINPKNSREIFRAIDGNEDVSPLAKNVAKVITDYIHFRNQRLVEAGVLKLSEINPDRFFKALHNPELLMNGGVKGVQNLNNFSKFVQAPFTKDYEGARNVWKEFIKERLNLEKTFQNTTVMDLEGKIDPKKMDDMLNEIYSNIITDNPETFEEGFGKQHMFFYWKNNEAMFDYASKYGRSDFFSMLMSDINQTSRKLGISQVFGSRPTKMYNRMVNLQQKVNPVFAPKQKLIKDTFDFLSGVDQTSVRPKVSNFFATLRSLKAMKSLGRISLVSLPDMSNGIANAKRWGFDLTEPLTTYATGAFNLMPSKERRLMASLFKEQIDAHLGYISRFLDAENMPQAIHTASTYFFRLVGLEAWDKGNKISALLVHAKLLHRLSSKTWEELPKETRLQFGKYNFTKSEWEVLKTKSQNGLFTLDNVTNLTDDEIRKIYGATSDQPLHLLKFALYRKVYTMFNVAVDNAVLRPGAYLRTMALMGTRSGTVAGEIARQVMQFKQFSITYLDKVIFQGLRDADGAQAKFGYMALLVGATTPLSFLSYYFNQIAQGKSLPSWDRMSWQEKLKVAIDVSVPPAGLFTSFFQSQNQGRDLIANALNPPLWQELSYALSAQIALANGDTKKFGKAMKKVGYGILPGASFPFIDPYMKKAFGEKVYLQPGQVQLYGK